MCQCGNGKSMCVDLEKPKTSCECNNPCNPQVLSPCKNQRKSYRNQCVPHCGVGKSEDYCRAVCVVCDRKTHVANPIYTEQLKSGYMGHVPGSQFQLGLSFPEAGIIGVAEFELARRSKAKCGFKKETCPCKCVHQCNYNRTNNNYSNNSNNNSDCDNKYSGRKDNSFNSNNMGLEESYVVMDAMKDNENVENDNNSALKKNAAGVIDITSKNCQNLNFKQRNCGGFTGWRQRCLAEEAKETDDGKKEQEREEGIECVICPCPVPCPCPFSPCPPCGPGCPCPPNCPPCCCPQPCCPACCCNPPCCPQPCCSIYPCDGIIGGAKFDVANAENEKSTFEINENMDNNKYLNKNMDNNAICHGGYISGKSTGQPFQKSQINYGQSQIGQSKFGPPGTGDDDIDECEGPKMIFAFPVPTATCRCPCPCPCPVPCCLPVDKKKPSMKNYESCPNPPPKPLKIYFAEKDQCPMKCEGCPPNCCLNPCMPYGPPFTTPCCNPCTGTPCCPPCCPGCCSPCCCLPGCCLPGCCLPGCCPTCPPGSCPPGSCPPGSCPPGSCPPGSCPPCGCCPCGCCPPCGCPCYSPPCMPLCTPFCSTCCPPADQPTQDQQIAPTSSSYGKCSPCFLPCCAGLRRSGGDNLTNNASSSSSPNLPTYCYSKHPDGDDLNRSNNANMTPSELMKENENETTLCNAKCKYRKFMPPPADQPIKCVCPCPCMPDKPCRLILTRNPPTTWPVSCCTCCRPAEPLNAALYPKLAANVIQQWALQKQRCITFSLNCSDYCYLPDDPNRCVDASCDGCGCSCESRC